MKAGERKESTDVVRRVRETPALEPTGTARAAGTVSLNVSPAMQDMAAQRGMAVRDGALILPADRYMAAASRLAKEWSTIVPVAILTGRALRAGTPAPATLTPDLLDALLVHDHQEIVACARTKEKDAEREREQKALRTRNVDQDLEAFDKKKEAVNEQERNAAGRADAVEDTVRAGRRETHEIERVGQASEPEPALDWARG